MIFKMSCIMMVGRMRAQTQVKEAKVRGRFEIWHPGPLEHRIWLRSEKSVDRCTVAAGKGRLAGIEWGVRSES